MPIQITPTAAASLLKALQFFHMASEYFADVSRDANASEYRRFHMDRQVRRCREIFNDIYGALNAEQTAVLKADLEDSTTLDSIFTNAALLTKAGRAELEQIAISIRDREMELLSQDDPL